MEPKPGWKTTEFWLTATTTAAAMLETVKGDGTPWARVAAVLLVGIYTWQRTRAKAG